MPTKTARLLPLAAELGSIRRRAAAAAATVMLLTLGAGLVLIVAGLAGEDGVVVGVLTQAGLFSAIALCALRCRRGGEDRRAWLALTAALTSWALGNLYYAAVMLNAGQPTGPTIADICWLGFYPAAYLCIGLHLRTNVRGLPPSTWLDGLVSVLAIAAVGTAAFVAPILDGAEGAPGEIIANGAYMIGDLGLAAIAIAVICLSQGRSGRSWPLLAGGLTIFALADSIYVYRLSTQPEVADALLDWMWLLGAAAMALAAWQAPHPRRTAVVGGWRTFALSAIACVASIAVLVIAGIADVAPAAVYFAAAALIAAMSRTALTFRELRLFAETRRQASTDELTGLPNRRWFHRRLAEAIEQARAGDTSLALLIIDLDRFKELNDTLGHHAGDRVLAQLGPRVRSALRAGDELARLGGDEFAALLPGASEAGAAGARIARALEERFTVEGIELQIAASIGVSLYPEHGSDAETLLKRADVAMYQAKARRSGTEFYARERDGHTRERLQLIGELRDAVAGRRLTLHYQPLLDLGRGRIAAVEALVRWQHPVHGMLPPGEFIPLAEQTGVIEPLTDLVLEEALAQAAAWRSRGLDLTMAVNVSATNLLQDGWTTKVLDALRTSGVRPDRLVVEITEDVLLTDPDRALVALDELSRNGVRVSLDDFGTGYSSLAYLKKLPVDELKVDRSFVLDMGASQADTAIVQTAIDLGRRLGIRVVVEGVEDARTLRRLTDYGADFAQGFHIARPLPAAELEGWLAAGGFVLTDDEHIERPGAMHALDAVQLDVRRR